MSRLPRYGIYIVIVPLLTWMVVREVWAEGYLLEVHETIFYVLAFSCPVLAATVAWDISGFDLHYLRVVAKTSLRLVAELLWVPLFAVLVGIIECSVMLWWRYTRRTAAGNPWWSMYLQAVLWMMMCVIIGAVAGALIHNRRRLSPVVAFFVVMGATLIRDYGALKLPYFVLAFGNFTMDSPISVVPGGLYQAVSAAVLFVCLAAGLIFLIRAKSGKPALVAAVVAVVAGTGVLSVDNAERFVPRAAPQYPVCTETVSDVRYCGWPEETALIESAGPKWATYVDSMAKLDLALDEGTYGLAGTLPDHEVKYFGHYDGGLYLSMMRTMTDVFVHEKCHDSPQVMETFALADMLDIWAAFSFKNPKQPDSVGRNTPRAQWVLSHTEDKPMEEQIAVMKPIAEDLLTCGSLGRAVMS